MVQDAIYGYIKTLQELKEEISQGRYLVLGERVSSLNFDSRSFGYLEKEHIIGKVLTQEEF